jgi:hypothetical protein
LCFLVSETEINSKDYQSPAPSSSPKEGGATHDEAKASAEFQHLLDEDGFGDSHRLEAETPSPQVVNELRPAEGKFVHELLRR